jgi:TolB-like protein/Flp pilus assembly protein TadD
MAEARVERRLAAILAADVAGYSRLMGADEEGTLAALKALRRELIDLKIAEHRGRIVKTTGDGVLVEFASAVDAVRCAMEIQRAIAERNAAIPEDRRVEFRIGINVGDIIIDEGDIYGDGVNIAARVETLASPGALCLSENAYQQMKGKLTLDVSDMGEQQLKNIAQSVRVYRVRLDRATATVAPALPDKPSIAVLPFANMSGDPEQEYFADGISEDIITGLSKLRWFFVIARNSSFIYKGKAIDVKRVARELGVRYVLEGSVRKSGNRVRITAQLIDASTGNHIWADRYDGDLTDIFALQDEITKKVVATIEPKLLEAESIRSQNRSPEDIGAWDMVMQANSQFWRVTKADSEAAIAMLTRAVERYPDYAPAHSMLAFMLFWSSYLIFIEPRTEQARSLAARAAQLDDSDPWAHLALGFAAFIMCRSEEAVEEYERAIDLNPNFAAAHGYLGWALAVAGQSDRAIPHIEEAMRMSPHDPQNAIFNAGLAVAHYLAGRYIEAVGFARKALQQHYGFIGGHRIYIASLAQAGRIDEAHAALARMKEIQPEVSIAWIKQYVPYPPGPMAHYLEGMLKAGLE